MKKFKTARSLEKAKNCVKKNFPLSPRHKKEVLLSLANDFHAIIEVHRPPLKF